MNKLAENENLSGERPPSPPSSQPASIPSEYGSIEAPHVVAPNYSWYGEAQRNRPQSSSHLAASLILLSGGMSLALSVGIGHIMSDYGKHAQYCWFIAVIIGAGISAFFAHNITSCAFNLAASLLVIAKGVIYTAFATNTSWIIILARYCDGIAFGLTLIPAILASSEQSVKTFRGRVMSFEQTTPVIGAIFMALFVNGWKNDVEINRAHGIASLIVGLLALGSTFVFTIESPIFHLRKNNETEALNVLRQLQKPTTITNETYELLNENKSLLEEDLARGRAENISNSWIPLIKITVLRALVSLSFSLPLTWGYFIVSTLNDVTNAPNYFWFVFMRLLGVKIAVWTMGRIGRKTISAIGLLTGSIFLLAVAILFPKSATDIVTENSPNAIIAFLIIYQLLSGFAAPASPCYLSEAFSLSVKPYFILISIIVENAVQIIVCTQTTFDSTANYAYVLAAIQFVFAIICYFTIPETKNTTLREALDMFKRTVYINLGNV